MALGLGAHQPLALLQSGLLLGLPVIAPSCQRRRKHGAHHSPGRLSQHAHIGLPLQIQVQPRLPALGQTRLHHALGCRLHKMLHTRLVCRLRLCRQGLGVLLRYAARLWPQAPLPSPLAARRSQLAAWLNDPRPQLASTAGPPLAQPAARLASRRANASAPPLRQAASNGPQPPPACACCVAAPNTCQATSASPWSDPPASSASLPLAVNAQHASREQPPPAPPSPSRAPAPC
eukprot:scaffold9529_cov51-Phaeocystis_antarctica.AAC.1